MLVVEDLLNDFCGVYFNQCDVGGEPLHWFLTGHECDFDGEFGTQYAPMKNIGTSDTFSVDTTFAVERMMTLCGCMNGILVGNIFIHS